MRFSTSVATPLLFTASAAKQGYININKQASLFRLISTSVLFRSPDTITASCPYNAAETCNDTIILTTRDEITVHSLHSYVTLNDGTFVGFRWEDTLVLSEYISEFVAKNPTLQEAWEGTKKRALGAHEQKKIEAEAH